MMDEVDGSATWGNLVTHQRVEIAAQLDPELSEASHTFCVPVALQHSLLAYRPLLAFIVIAMPRTLCMLLVLLVGTQAFKPETQGTHCLLALT